MKRTVTRRYELDAVVIKNAILLWLIGEGHLPPPNINNIRLSHDSELNVCAIVEWTEEIGD